jgi:hypothetical protein
LPRIIVQRNLIAEGGYFVLEHTHAMSTKKFEGYEFHRNYGSTVFTFFNAAKKSFIRNCTSIKLNFLFDDQSGTKETLQAKSGSICQRLKGLS